MIFRLRKITIDNFCAIGHGSLAIQKSTEDAPSNAEVLAVYGGNGTGKSSFIQALLVVKKIWTLDDGDSYMEKVRFDFSPHMIRNESDYSSIKLEIECDTGNFVFSIAYALDLVPDGNSLKVSNEVMKLYNKDECSIFKTGKKPSSYLCRQLAYYCIKNDRVDSVSKELYKELKNDPGNQSFFFRMLTNHEDDLDAAIHILFESLSYWFWSMDIFTDYDWSELRSGSFPTLSKMFVSEKYDMFLCLYNNRLEKVMLFEEEDENLELKLHLVEEKIKELNLFLQCVDKTFILETEIIYRGKDHIPELHVYSSKGDGSRIPIYAESYGRRKILSMAQSLSCCMNNRNYLLVIDEMDEGLFEYFFGELITAIQENGSGQLIYTAHNLISAERLGNLNLAFTTIDPDNRFKRITDVKNENNLRSLYFKEIDGKRNSSSFGVPLDSTNISKALSLGYEVVTYKKKDSDIKDQD